MGITIYKKYADELNQKEIDTINFWRVKEFNSSFIWQKGDTRNLKDLFIFLGVNEESNKIVSIARIRPVELWHGETQILAVGLGSVVAIQKGMGYGTQIVREVISHVSGTYAYQGLPIIGFCNEGVSSFYSNLGFDIIPKGAKCFIYVNEDDIEDCSDTNDVIYFGNKNEGSLFELINQGIKVKHYIPKW